MVRICAHLPPLTLAVSVRQHWPALLLQRARGYRHDLRERSRAQCDWHRAAAPLPAVPRVPAVDAEQRHVELQRAAEVLRDDLLLLRDRSGDKRVLHHVIIELLTFPLVRRGLRCISSNGSCERISTT